MKSFVTRIKDIDLSETCVIDRLVTSSEIVNHKYAGLKSAYPNSTEKEIWMKLNESVLKDCIFSKALKQALKSYELHIDEQDITNIETNFVKKYRSFANSTKEHIRFAIKQALIKDLVIKDLSQYWHIQATQQEIQLTLERLDKHSRHVGGIDQYKAINSIQKQIIREKTVNRLISELKYTINWDSINKHTQEFKDKIKSK